MILSNLPRHGSIVGETIILNYSSLWTTPYQQNVIRLKYLLPVLIANAKSGIFDG